MSNLTWTVRAADGAYLLDCFSKGLLVGRRTIHEIMRFSQAAAGMLRRKGSRPSVIQTKGAFGLLVGIFFILGITSVFAGSGDVFVAPSVQAADVVYSPESGRIYASAPANSDSFPNSIVVIDPLSGAVEATLPAGNDPRILAISDDFSMLYAACRGDGRIRRWNLTTYEMDLEFELKSSSGGILYAADLKVMPGRPQTVVVARETLSRNLDSIAVYDHGNERPGVISGTPGTVRGDRLVFPGSPDLIYAYDSRTSEAAWRWLKITPDGIHVEKMMRGLGVTGEPIYHEGLIHGAWQMLDLEKGFPVAAHFPDATAFAVDRPRSRHFSARVERQQIIVRAVSLDHFGLVGETVFPGFHGQTQPTRLIRWGERGLAVISGHGDLLLAQLDMVATTGSQADLTLTADGPAEAITDAAFSYRFTVKNEGPSRAHGVHLRHKVGPLQPSETIVVSGGNWEFDGDDIVVSLGTMEVGESSNVQIGRTPTSQRAVEYTAEVSALEFDPFTPNNRASVIVRHAHLPSDHPVRSLNLRVNDVRYHQSLGLVFATLSWDSPHYPNHLAAFEPESGNLVFTRFAGSRPNRLALSRDERFLYIGLDGSGEVRRYDVDEDVFDLRFQVGRTEDVVLLAGDIQVLPNHSDSVAIARVRASGSPPAAGVAIYDGGTMRANTTPGHTGPLHLAFSDLVQGRLYGNGSGRFFRMTVDADGVRVNSSVSSTGTPIIYDNGWVLDESGNVLAAENALVTQSFDARGAVVSNAGSNRVVFLDFSSLETLRVFQRNTLTLVAAQPLRFGVSRGRLARTAQGFVAARPGLDFITSSIGEAGPVDLAVEAVDPPPHIRTWTAVNHHFRVTNHGSYRATNVKVEILRPSFYGAETVSATQGVARLLGSAPSYLLGTIDPGESATVTVGGRFFREGDYVIEARATSPHVETNPATATGVVTASVLPQITLSLQVPSSATEGDGILNDGGRLFAHNAAPYDSTISLTSSNEEKVLVPESVVLPAGHASVFFPITIIDNDLLDGTSRVEIAASGWGLTSPRQTISVHDNETTTLAMILPAEVMARHERVFLEGRLQLADAPDRDVSVSLSRIDNTILSLPQSTVVRAGEKEAVFTFSIPQMSALSEPLLVEAEASVVNWSVGRAEMVILPPSGRPILTAPPTEQVIRGFPTMIRGLGIEVTDDPQAIVSVVFSVGSGSLNLATDVVNGVEPDQIEGNGSGSITVVASVAAIANTLQANGLTLLSLGEVGSTVEMQFQAMRENENAEIVIGMQIHPQPIQSWRTEHFGNAVDDSNLRDTHWGDFADPGSGRINLLSYAMGLSPFERGQESLPQAETLFAADQKYLTLRFRRRLDDPTLQFVPEVSTDMAQWATGPEHIVEVMTAFVSDGFEEVLYRAFLPMDQENSIFMRLRVFRIEFDTAEDVRY